MPRNPWKRLEKIQQELAEIARGNCHAKCTCRTLTLAATAEHFKAEMNQTCPVHGFRKLGKIQILEVQIHGKNGIVDRSVGIAELVHEYEGRLAQYQEQLLFKNDDDEV